MAATPRVAAPVPANARWVAPPTPPPLRPVASAPLQPVRYQQPGDSQTDENQSVYQIQLEPPGLERISRLDSDAKLRERIRQETQERDPKERVQFPEEPILSRDTYMGRGSIWPARHMIVEPHYVAYEPLFFQDINAERYGWDFGIVHPVLGAGKFYYDLALLPMHCAAWKCQTDTSAGYCLPGDPVPFKLYPPEITFEGTVAEIAVIAALVAIFP
ncbi:MAG: hypothetical protein U0736_09680 [Gemmataceae bacterium]